MKKIFLLIVIIINFFFFNFQVLDYQKELMKDLYVGRYVNKYYIDIVIPFDRLKDYTYLEAIEYVKSCIIDNNINFDDSKERTYLGPNYKKINQNKIDEVSPIDLNQQLYVIWNGNIIKSKVEKYIVSLSSLHEELYLFARLKINEININSLYDKNEFKHFNSYTSNFVWTNQNLNSENINNLNIKYQYKIVSKDSLPAVVLKYITKYIVENNINEEYSFSVYDYKDINNKYYLIHLREKNLRYADNKSCQVLTVIMDYNGNIRKKFNRGNTIPYYVCDTNFDGIDEIITEQIYYEGWTESIFFIDLLSEKSFMLDARDEGL